MKQMLSFVAPVLMGVIAVAVFGSWIMMAWWTSQFLLVRSRVISEIKPFLPSVEKDLNFLGTPKNQNGAVPPLLKELAETHVLSENLSPETKRDLKATINYLSLWRRAFFSMCGVGVALVVTLMIVCLILNIFFPTLL